MLKVGVIMKKRKELMLFFLDLFVLGIVVTSLSWAFEVYISSEYSVIILTFSFLLVLILRASARKNLSLKMF